MNWFNRLAHFSTCTQLKKKKKNIWEKNNKKPTPLQTLDMLLGF